MCVFHLNLITINRRQPIDSHESVSRPLEGGIRLTPFSLSHGTLQHPFCPLAIMLTRRLALPLVSLCAELLAEPRCYSL